MTYILTATGVAFDLRLADPAHIRLRDIAHHLAQLNRFTGACKRPYSVAEHSLLVVQMLEHKGVTNPSTLLAALLHDAHEAYVADLSSPMKLVLGDAWKATEWRVQLQVQRRFSISAVSRIAGPLIRWADLTALSTERAQLMPPGGPVWAVETSHPAADWVDLGSREAMTWQDWRNAFTDKFQELVYARALKWKQNTDATERAQAEGAGHG